MRRRWAALAGAGWPDRPTNGSARPASKHSRGGLKLEGRTASGRERGEPFFFLSAGARRSPSGAESLRVHPALRAAGPSRGEANRRPRLRAPPRRRGLAAAGRASDKPPPPAQGGRSRAPCGAGPSKKKVVVERRRGPATRRRDRDPWEGTGSRGSVPSDVEWHRGRRGHSTLLDVPRGGTHRSPSGGTRQATRRSHDPRGPRASPNGIHPTATDMGGPRAGARI